MTLKADDGTPLEVKEAIVLDVNGKPIAQPPPGNEWGAPPNFGKLRVFKLNGLWSLLALLAVGGILTLGAVFMGGFFAILLGFWIVRVVLRAVGMKV